MIQFESNDKKYNLPTGWEEVTLNTFIRFCKIQEAQALIELPEEMLITALLEALCNVPQGEFEEMSFGQLITLSNEVKNFNEENFKKLPLTNNVWIIDGVTYTYHKDPNNYSVGEVADIRQIEAAKKNNYDWLLKIAAIVIRPATLVISEAGVEHYKLIKRSAVDTPKLESVVGNMKAYEVMSIINFFLTGLKR